MIIKSTAGGCSVPPKGGARQEPRRSETRGRREPSERQPSLGKPAGQSSRGLHDHQDAAAVGVALVLHLGHTGVRRGTIGVPMVYAGVCMGIQVRSTQVCRTRKSESGKQQCRVARAAQSGTMAAPLSRASPRCCNACCAEIVSHGRLSYKPLRRFHPEIARSCVLCAQRHAQASAEAALASSV